MPSVKVRQAGTTTQTTRVIAGLDGCHGSRGVEAAHRTGNNHTDARDPPPQAEGAAALKGTHAHARQYP
jgi:hypothetical protein